jgi:hypothetical protein
MSFAGKNMKRREEKKWENVKQKGRKEKEKGIKGKEGEKMEGQSKINAK